MASTRRSRSERIRHWDHRRRPPGFEFLALTLDTRFAQIYR